MAEEKLRAATWEDRKLLFDWANDRVVREASFQTEPIAWETHVKWFDGMMQDADTLPFIYECDGIPAGQVRLKLENHRGIISYSIAAEFRGGGMAKRMLSQLETVIKRDYPKIQELIAEVKSENTASKKVFENLEYRECTVIYKKSL